MCSTWLCTLKNWKYWMEIARILFNSGRFCRYVTMLLSMEKSHRIGLCELSKAGLRLSCFLLFFSSWRWGNKGKKKRDGVFYTGRYLKILFFSLETAATWCCSRSGHEAAAVRTARLQKQQTPRRLLHARRLAARPGLNPHSRPSQTVTERIFTKPAQPPPFLCPSKT